MGIEKGTIGPGQIMNVKSKITIRTLYAVLIVDYTDSYGNNPRMSKQVGILDIMNKTFGVMASPYENEILDFLESIGVKING